MKPNMTAVRNGWREQESAALIDEARTAVAGVDRLRRLAWQACEHKESPDEECNLEGRGDRRSVGHADGACSCFRRQEQGDEGGPLRRHERLYGQGQLQD